MRRPLKPFVTEYKSTARRPKDAFDLQPFPEHEPGGGDHSRLQDITRETTRNVPPPSEDGYDAALRAADALFAPSPATKPAAAAPAGVASTPASMPPERGSGRILEAIVETPSDRFAELEAEYAPKRRGRKPGSKNKPKPVSIAAFEAPAQATLAKPKATSRALNLDFVDPGPAAPARPAIPALLENRPRPNERFGWVRTTLRPGERWKRRIPKVAW